jgi:negative regulator of replication initiation
MRTIELDTDVFSRIWAHRAEGEETENEILRRLLGAQRQDRQGGDPSPPKNHGTAVAQVRGRAKWRDDVMQGLTELGGTAPLADIYRKVRAIRRAAGRSLPPSTEAVIRRELENNSSDSDSFTRERDWFAMPQGKGAGIWSIRKGS